MDSPYELNLNRKAVRGSTSPIVTVGSIAAGSEEATPNPIDAPFTPAELERILRMYDLDTSELPDRLRLLLDGAGGPSLALLRNIITTDSFDLPTPPVLPTRDMRKIAGTKPILSPSISDLLRVRLTAGGFVGNVNAAITQMLSPEIVAGLRMDINRPFGNGRDDDNNHVVDEPMEVENAIWNSTNMSVPARHTPGTPIPPNYANGFDINQDDTLFNTVDKQMARQLYARYLFVLMMMLKDEAYVYDADGDGTPTSLETTYAIAQWAINVVDFRDSDSIMTPFQFNHRSVQGRLDSDRRSDGRGRSDEDRAGLGV